MIKATLIAGCSALFLSGCTADDIINARQVTIEDGFRYVQENHERRRVIRQKLYELQDAIIAGCQARAAASSTEGDTDTALAVVETCLEFLDEAYPDLATLKALREGREQVNNLKTGLPEEE